MPTYENLCQKCGHQFDTFQSMLEAPVKKCPKCGKRAVKRLVGAGAALIFKGTGFYSTDYKAKPLDKPAGGDGKPAAGDAKGAATPASNVPPPFQGRPAPSSGGKSTKASSSARKK